MREGESDSDTQTNHQDVPGEVHSTLVGKIHSIQTVHKNGLKQTLCPILSSSANPPCTTTIIGKTWKNNYIQMTQFKTIEYVRPCRHMHLSLLHHHIAKTTIINGMYSQDPVSVRWFLQVFICLRNALLHVTFACQSTVYEYNIMCQIVPTNFNLCLKRIVQLSSQTKTGFQASSPARYLLLRLSAAGSTSCCKLDPLSH